MGLFSGKTTIHVSSVTYNMAGDANERQNFLRDTLTYLVAADESVGERLPRMYLNSLGMKIKRAYRHAALMPQGLPTSSMQLWEYNQFEDAVQVILNDEFGLGFYKVEDAYISEGGRSATVERYLNKTYGWDSVTGLMSNPPAGFADNADVSWKAPPPPRYKQTAYEDGVENISLNYIIEFRHDPGSDDPDLVQEIGLATISAYAVTQLVALISKTTTSTRSDTTTSRAFISGDVTETTTVTTTSTAGSQVTTTVTTTSVTTDGTTTTTRIRIVDTTNGIRESKTYDLGTGQWPTLDALWASRSDIEQTFFPSIPFRVDNQDMLADNLSETDNYKSVIKLCKLLGVGAIQIRDQINNNQSIKDIDYAFLQPGVNMNTESQAEMAYLFEFWDLCRQRSTNTQAKHEEWTSIDEAVRSKPGTNSLVIQDPQSKDGAYKITIEWDYINRTTVAGMINPEAGVSDYDIIRGATVTHEIGATENRWQVDSTIVSIRKQISLTHYEQISISGAVHKNDVYQGKVVETLAKDARADPEKNEGFLIPLHMGVFASLSLVVRTQLAQECMYLVFNCYVKVKQKWYQTGVFKIILAIILIIITVLSWGTAAPATASVWGAVTVGAAVGISAALAGLILSFVYGYLASYLLGKWKNGFISVFGEKWAGVVMAIVQIVVSYATGGGSFTSGGWLQTAVKIIDIASQLFTAYAKGAMAVNADRFEDWMKKAEDDKKLLDKLSTDFFGNNDLVSIDYLLELQKTLREDTPTVFLSRTLMTGSDVVDITLGQISEMAEMTLQPRLQGIYA